MTDAQQRSAAKQFAADWAGKGYEKGHSQTFWLALLSKVYGVAEPDKFITFEDQIMLDHTSFIDGFIPSTHVLIEQKGIGKDLNKPIKQSDGSLLTPFQQAKRYAAELPYSQRPRWIVTCNFAEFHVYDMERPTARPRSSSWPIWKRNTTAYSSWWTPGARMCERKWKFPCKQVNWWVFSMTRF